MKKDEVIKEAYGKYYDFSKPYLNEYGVLNILEVPKEKSLSLIHLKNEIPCESLINDSHSIRPKSLKGIEDNNGWIKIENEEDLPKEGMTNYLYCVNDEPSIHVMNLKQINQCYKDGMITHYQPIDKPKPPIY